jgi:hypothetical protein
LDEKKRRGGRVRVRWDVIDRSVAGFTAGSVVPLLSAAIDSPFLGVVREQLWLVWTRVLRCPPDGTRVAGLGDLPDLVEAGISADPRPQIHLIDAVDPRLVVRYRCGGSRLRVHPGELEHPLLFLRSASMVAAAVDEFLIRRIGFGLDDVIELTLRTGDVYLSQLSPVWPSCELPADGEDARLEIDGLVTEAEVTAAVRMQALDLIDIANWCSRPDQAALALQWLSRGHRDLRMSIHPDGLSLGPVVAVATDRGTVPVPAAFLAQTLLAASARLTALAARDRSSLRTLRAFTCYRMEDLLRGPAKVAGTGAEGADQAAGGGREMPAEVASNDWEGEYPAFVGTAFSGVITSYLGRTNFWVAIDQARQCAPAVIAEAAAQAGVTLTGRAVVIYGGLPGLVLAGPDDVVCVHVEEFAEMLADAGGDQDMVAQFLSEVSLHPGLAGLLYVDVLDVWWHWRDHKMIGPLFPEGAGVAVLPYEGKPDWERAAGLEPIEDVLAGAGFPESGRWPMIRVDEAGQATMLMPATGPARAVLVRADPPLLVIESLDDGAPLGIMPDTMYGLADGIRITAGRHQDIADGLRLADGMPLTFLVSVTGDRQPPVDDAEKTGIAIAIDPERPRVGLQFGPEFFERLANDPQKAHGLVGWAMHHAVAGLGGAPAVDRERFLAAWNATPPIMMVQRFLNTGPASVPIDPVPHGDFARARAFRSIAMAIESAELPSGSFSDRDVCAHLTAVFEALLRRRLHECDPAVVADVARALNAAHAAHWRYSHDLHFALSAPWAADWQAAALEGEDPATRIRPLELLLEFLLLTPPGGDHHLDRYELAELEEIAQALLEQRTRLNGIDVGLTYMMSDLDLPDEEDDQPTAEPAEGTTLRLNFRAYSEARARDRVRIRMPTPSDMATQRTASSLQARAASTRHPARAFREFEPIASLDPPSYLLSTDALMRDTLGTGLDGIRAVLGTAVDWPTAQTGIAVADAGQLAHEAEEWSGLLRSEIDAAVTLLSLDPQTLPGPVHRYWEVERLSHRLRVRPFPVIDGKLWIMPWAAEATQELFLVYFHDSRLPYVDPALPPSAATALQLHRQRRNLQLEKEAAAVARDLGLPHRANWTTQEAQTAGLANLPGEVDLIIADATKRRLWICEVKDPEAAFAPPALGRHIERFTRRKGYIAKLLAKASAIAMNPAPAAAACEATDETTWTVVPLMVTRAIEPAAFLDNPKVAFTVLDDLPVVLQAEHEPAHGHARIGE